MSKASKSCHFIESAIGYTFSDRSLLKTLLTHRSAGPNNNERLEYLGDAFLNFTIAQWLFSNLSMSEGELSIARAYLVSKKQLVLYAKPLQFLEHLDIQNTQVINDSPKSESFIADAFEALWGAIAYEAGFVTARDLFFVHYEKQLQESLERAKAKDSKTQLQELSQRRFKKLPVYTLIKKEGQGHQLQFKVLCKVERYQTNAYGRSIKSAQSLAAEQMLRVINE